MRAASCSTWPCEGHEAFDRLRQPARTRYDAEITFKAYATESCWLLRAAPRDSRVLDEACPDAFQSWLRASARGPPIREASLSLRRHLESETSSRRLALTPSHQRFGASRRHG